MPARTRRGFTLTELMVVIGIIALLAASIMPYFQKIFAIQRTVACAHNLEKIGQAFSVRAANRGISYGETRWSVSTFSWQIDLLTAYLSGESSVFTCPESHGDVGSGEMAREKLKEIYIEVFSGAARDYDTWLWDVPLDEDFSSEWVWRLSSEQYAEFVQTDGHGQNYDYSGYVEGEDPSTYWFVFEDQGHHGGGDKDYYDIMLRVHITDMALEIMPEQGGAGYNFALCMGRGEEKEYIAENLKNEHHKTLTIEGSFAATDYGLNSVVNMLHPGGKKLLALDYELMVAKGSDYDDPHPWLENEEIFPTQMIRNRKVPAFFRHGGKANSLFCDGSVKAMTFNEITIYDDETREMYWNP